jgi:hypothetical protein
MSANAEQRRARARRNRSCCVHCGAPTSGKDHVPPKGIFGDLLKSPPGVNLITVPACDKCNLGRTEDDAYFRDALYLMAQRDGETPHTEPVGSAIARAAKHAGTSHKIPIQSFLRGGFPAWRGTNGSGVLEHVTGFKVNWTRIKRVVERTARGLYWHHRNERVPDGYEVHVSGDKERDEFKYVEQVETWGDLSLDALKGHKRHIHESAFSYGVAFATDDALSAAFSFVVYRKVLFLALVMPKDEVGLVFPRPPAIFVR